MKKFSRSMIIGKGGDCMKKHKLFVWLTVGCALLTIITGYEKK